MIEQLQGRIADLEADLALPTPFPYPSHGRSQRNPGGRRKPRCDPAADIARGPHGEPTLDETAIRDIPSSNQKGAAKCPVGAPAAAYLYERLRRTSLEAARDRGRFERAGIAGSPQNSSRPRAFSPSSETEESQNEQDDDDCSDDPYDLVHLGTSWCLSDPAGSPSECGRPQLGSTKRGTNH